MNEVENSGQLIDQNIRLLRSLSDELKLPLTQIARIAELGESSAGKHTLKNIETTADAAIKLIDSYLFSTQVLMGQQALDLSPVSLSATMQDTAHYLDKLAKQYNCTIEVSNKTNKRLIMAHPKGLQSALIGLAYSFITSQSEQKQKIILIADRSKFGTTTGVVSAHSELKPMVLQKARALRGFARQSMSSVSHRNGAGVFVADILFSAMASHLQVTRRRQGSGFIAPMALSKQLALL